MYLISKRKKYTHTHYANMNLYQVVNDIVQKFKFPTKIDLSTNETFHLNLILSGQLQSVECYSALKFWNESSVI